MNGLSNKLKKIFDTVDTSEDGLISWEEFQECCEKLSITITDTDIADFRQYGVPGKNALDANGFRQFIQKRLRNIFHRIDTNGTGFLDHAEILAILKEIGINLSERQVDGILQSMDKNQDQKVDFSEFCAFFADLPSPNMHAIAMKWSSGEGLDCGSDVVPINMPPVEMPLGQFMMAGGIAGITSRTFTAPLEKMKIVAQVLGIFI